MKIATYALMLLSSVTCACFQAPAVDQTPDLRNKIYVLETEVAPTYTEPRYICKEAQKRADFYGKSYHVHGNNVTEIIGKKIDSSKYCVMPLNIYEGKPDDLNFKPYKYLNALKTALADPLTVGINLSLSGAFVRGEYELFKKLLARDIKIVVSAGNEGVTLGGKECKIYPACLRLLIKNDNLIVVTSNDVYNKKKNKMVANKVKFKHVLRSGYMRGYSILLSGTSQAAAEETGDLFKKETEDVSK